MKKLVIIFLIVFGLVFGGFYIYDQNQDNEKDTDENGQIAGDTADSRNKITDTELIIYATENEQSAFDLLQDNAEIEYNESDFGVFVTSINGLAGDEKHFWSLYVNGEFSQSAADLTMLTKGAEMRWHYEEIKL